MVLVVVGSLTAATSLLPRSGLSSDRIASASSPPAAPPGAGFPDGCAAIADERLARRSACSSLRIHCIVHEVLRPEPSAIIVAGPACGNLCVGDVQVPLSLCSTWPSTICRTRWRLPRYRCRPDHRRSSLGNRVVAISPLVIASGAILSLSRIVAILFGVITASASFTEVRRIEDLRSDDAPCICRCCTFGSTSMVAAASGLLILSVVGLPICLCSRIGGAPLPPMIAYCPRS